MAIADLVTEPPVPPEFAQRAWEAFEERSLALIGSACERLKKDGKNPKWKETQYSWALLRHLRVVCKDSPMYPGYDEVLLSDEDFDAGVAPQNAPKIDLVVRRLNGAPSVYYGVEAKILVSKAVGSYTRAKTVAYYVHEGIQRYIDGRYGRGLASGALVGYVLNGSAAESVDSINQRVSDHGVSCAKPLCACGPPPPWPDHYDSLHPRSSGDQIRLHHLFVVF